MVSGTRDAEHRAELRELSAENRERLSLGSRD